MNRDQMEKLLEENGKEIYEKLQKTPADSQGTIWAKHKGDFGVDTGPAPNGTKKPWHLQVNRKPTTKSGQAVRRQHSTHDRLFWDHFDMENQPDYDT